ncbi:MAG: hypothetical protein ACRBDL_08915 [Alphaproteobacteria bacterium]
MNIIRYSLITISATLLLSANFSHAGLFDDLKEAVGDVENIAKTVKDTTFESTEASASTQQSNKKTAVNDQGYDVVAQFHGDKNKVYYIQIQSIKNAPENKTFLNSLSREQGHWIKAQRCKVASQSGRSNTSYKPQKFENVWVNNFRMEGNRCYFDDFRAYQNNVKKEIVVILADDPSIAKDKYNVEARFMDKAGDTYQFYIRGWILRKIIAHTGGGDTLCNKMQAKLHPKTGVSSLTYTPKKSKKEEIMFIGFRSETSGGKAQCYFDDIYKSSKRQHDDAKPIAVQSSPVIQQPTAQTKPKPQAKENPLFSNDIFRAQEAEAKAVLDRCNTFGRDRINWDCACRAERFLEEVRKEDTSLGKEQDIQKNPELVQIRQDVILTRIKFECPNLDAKHEEKYKFCQKYRGFAQKMGKPMAADKVDSYCACYADKFIQLYKQDPRREKHYEKKSRDACL